MLVDVHAHLDYAGFSEPVDVIIRKAHDAGVVSIINCGLNTASNRATKLLSSKFDIIKPAFGFYPTDAEQVDINLIEREIAWIKNNKPIAISEIGMDGKNGKNMAIQEKVFRLFVKLANELSVPVIVHTRQAELQCFKVLEELKCQKVVLHCYTGPSELVLRAKKNKWSFSIPPIIAYNKQFHDLVFGLELGQILTETDSPYLAPKPGQQNRPENVAVAVSKIAEIKGITPEEATKIIFLNYMRLFA